MKEEEINKLAEKIAEIIMKKLEATQRKLAKQIMEDFWNAPLPPPAPAGTYTGKSYTEALKELKKREKQRKRI